MPVDRGCIARSRHGSLVNAHTNSTHALAVNRLTLLRGPLVKDSHRCLRFGGPSLCWLAGLFMLVLIGCKKQGAPASVAKLESPMNKVTVFAAASTFAALEESAKAFETDQHIGVTIVPGPSSALSKQIVEGSDTDLFLSADRASVSYLAQKQLVENSVDLLTNRLVIVVHAESMRKITNIAELAHDSIKRIAVAEAKVPAGEYARQALAKAGILDAVTDKMVSGVDAKATTQLVIRGEAEVGIIYRTDAIGSQQLRVAYEIPTELHAPIVYVLTRIKRDGVHPASAAFFDYLQQQAAREIFARYDFGLVAQ